MANTPASTNIATISRNMSNTEDTSVTREQQTCFLLRLPDEVLLSILKYAGGLSTFALRETCVRLHLLTPAWNELSREETCDVLSIIERYPRYEDLYACYRCLDLQHASRFWDIMKIFHFDKLGPHDYNDLCQMRRLCFACQSPHLLLGKGFDIDGGIMRKCAECETMTCEFCIQCRFCYHCALSRPRSVPITKSFGLTLCNGKQEEEEAPITFRTCRLEDHEWNDKPTNQYYNMAKSEASRKGGVHNTHKVFLDAWRDRHIEDLGDQYPGTDVDLDDGFRREDLSRQVHVARVRRLDGAKHLHLRHVRYGSSMHKCRWLGFAALEML